VLTVEEEEEEAEAEEVVAEEVVAEEVAAQEQSSTPLAEASSSLLSVEAPSSKQ
jgi:hypothetical protein